MAGKWQPLPVPMKVRVDAARAGGRGCVHVGKRETKEQPRTPLYNASSI